MPPDVTVILSVWIIAPVAFVIPLLLVKLLIFNNLPVLLTLPAELISNLLFSLLEVIVPLLVIPPDVTLIRFAWIFALAPSFKSLLLLFKLAVIELTLIFPLLLNVFSTINLSAVILAVVFSLINPASAFITFWTTIVPWFLK